MCSRWFVVRAAFSWLQAAKDRADEAAARTAKDRLLAAADLAEAKARHELNATLTATIDRFIAEQSSGDATLAAGLAKETADRKASTRVEAKTRSDADKDNSAAIAKEVSDRRMAVSAVEKTALALGKKMDEVSRVLCSHPVCFCIHVHVQMHVGPRRARPVVQSSAKIGNARVLCTRTPTAKFHGPSVQQNDTHMNDCARN